MCASTCITSTGRGESCRIAHGAVVGSPVDSSYRSPPPWFYWLSSYRKPLSSAHLQTHKNKTVVNLFREVWVQTFSASRLGSQPVSKQACSNWSAVPHLWLVNCSEDVCGNVTTLNQRFDELTVVAYKFEPNSSLFSHVVCYLVT